MTEDNGAASGLASKGDPGLDMIQAAESGRMDSQRLLDPGSTPEKLKEYYFGIGIPCPTRTMTRETALAVASLTKPMFGNPVYYSPDSMEVGDARNRMVEMGLKDGLEWMFFIDYDVCPPMNALVKLMSLDVDVASGVYHLKTVPSYPLIMVNGWKYAFDDYDLGDLIEADGCGMGCTLIKMDVFRKIEPPWFKTVPGYIDSNPGVVLPHLTEDIYFCKKVKKAGLRIVVDTMVQAHHVDSKNGITYHYVPNENGKGRGCPGWSYRIGEDVVTETVGDVNHPGRKWANTKPRKARKKGLDLGCGGGGPSSEDLLGIDLHFKGENVLQGDVSDLAWYRKEHGVVPRIYASHVLEHMDHIDVPQIFRDWVSTLKEDGEMKIRVPDGEYHMRAILERVDKGEDVDPQCDWLNRTIYGYQVGPGQYHKTLFTENRLRQLALSCGLVDVNVEKVEHEGNGSTMPTTAELVLTGKRGK
jgi:hypothetical protein